jgi:NAD(P)H-hydrate epimerase
MMGLKKILSKDEIKEIDLLTIDKNNIQSIDLMEQASEACVQYLMSQHIANQKIMVLCGPGNNGGDGLAIARLLNEHGFDTKAFLINTKKEVSSDCSVNLKRLPSTTLVSHHTQIPDLSNADIIIDALFGIGLHGNLEGLYAQVIQVVNDSKKLVYSVDVPSGLPADSITNSDLVIQADITMTFQRPKVSFFFPEHKKYVSEWIVIDIGLDEKLIQKSHSKIFVLDKEIQNQVRSRKMFSHKGHYGHALLLAGSYGKMGAATLAARAMMKSGVGLLTVQVPKCGVNIMQVSVPEAMCVVDPSDYSVTELSNIKPYNVVALGPGIGTDASTQQLIHHLLKSIDVPLVIDADAINILSKNPDWSRLIPKGSVLTPHIKEFDRLIGGVSQTSERLIQAQEFAAKHHCVIVLKDACTWVIDDNGNRFIHYGGNPGMSTAGSGDVLTGIIGALIAQKYDSTEAACIGVYHHGLAGNIGAQTTGHMGLTASTIINNLKID